jgi:hypothetical protein
LCERDRLAALLDRITTARLAASDSKDIKDYIDWLEQELD